MYHMFSSTCSVPAGSLQVKIGMANAS